MGEESIISVIIMAAAILAMLLKSGKSTRKQPSAEEEIPSPWGTLADTPAPKPERPEPKQTAARPTVRPAGHPARHPDRHPDRHPAVPEAELAAEPTVEPSVEPAVEPLRAIKRTSGSSGNNGDDSRSRTSRGNNGDNGDSRSLKSGNNENCGEASGCESGEKAFAISEEDFDLRRAILYSEILKPKFDE